MHLRHALGYALHIEKKYISPPKSMSIASSDSPFHKTVDCSVPIKCEDVIFGLTISQCIYRERGFVSDIEFLTTVSNIPTWKRHIWHAYIIAVNGTPVSSKNNIEKEVATVRIKYTLRETDTLILNFALDMYDHIDVFDVPQL